MVDQDILNKLNADNGEKENFNLEQIKEGVSNGQDGRDLPENSEDDVEWAGDKAGDMSPQKNGVDVAGLSVGDDKCQKDSMEDDARDVQFHISQRTNKDNTLKIMEEDLRKFVTGFIGAMSYKIEKIYSKEHSSYSE